MVPGTSELEHLHYSNRDDDLDLDSNSEAPTVFTKAVSAMFNSAMNLSVEEREEREAERTQEVERARSDRYWSIDDRTPVTEDHQ